MTNDETGASSRGQRASDGVVWPEGVREVTGTTKCDGRTLRPTRGTDTTRRNREVNRLQILRKSRTESPVEWSFGRVSGSDPSHDEVVREGISHHKECGIVSTTPSLYVPNMVSDIETLYYSTDHVPSTGSVRISYSLTYLLV